jgi:hypothetical protein
MTQWRPGARYAHFSEMCAVFSASPEAGRLDFYALKIWAITMFPFLETDNMMDCIKTSLADQKVGACREAGLVEIVKR